MRTVGRGLFGGPVVGWLVGALVLLTACTSTAQQPGSGRTPLTGAEQPVAKTEQPAEKTRLTVLYTVDVDAWNPYGHSGSTVYAMWMHVMEPLVLWDPVKGETVPHLAESWSNPDHNTWEFKLRQGIKFHDGTEFTAQDVVHSYDRIINDKTSKQGSALAHVDKMEAPDKYTVRIHTKNPDAAFLDRINNRVITSKAHYDKYGEEEGDKQPIGTGPYKFKEWVSGQRWVVERNPEYWGPLKPTFDEVVFRPVPEAEARITALLNGEADIAAFIPPQFISRVTNSGVASTEAARGSRLMFLAMNPTFKPWDNKALRQAVNYAIDKQGLIKGVLEGRAYELQMPIGEGMYAYDPTYKSPYSYDPAKAKELLAQAGYPNGLEVDMQCSNGRYLKDKELCEAMVQMLGQVGIKAKLTTPEWGKFWGDVQKGQVPFYLLGRGNVVDPSEYLHQYFRTGVTPRLSYSNPEVDEMLLTEQKEFDPQKRVKLLREAMAKIVDEAPMVFLFQYEDTYGVSEKVDWKARGDEYVFAWEAKPKQ